MSTPPLPGGSYVTVQRLSKLPRPRVRLGYDLHRLRACECIEKMFPFLLQVAAAQASTRVVPTQCRSWHSAQRVGRDRGMRRNVTRVLLRGRACSTHATLARRSCRCHTAREGLHLPVSREAQPTLIHVLLSTHKEAKGICVRSC